MADNMPSVNEFRTGRSDSTTSTTSATSTSSAAAGKTAPPAPQRRSSHALFETLTAQKRGTDPASVARRQSMNEQRPQAGFLGQMWNNWVHGNK